MKTTQTTQTTQTKSLIEQIANFIYIGGFLCFLTFVLTTIINN